MTITKGTINPRWELTKTEKILQRGMGFTREEVLLQTRYRPIIPIEEDEHNYYYGGDRYGTYAITKDRVVIADNTIYCPTYAYERKGWG